MAGGNDPKQKKEGGNLIPGVQTRQTGSHGKSSPSSQRDPLSPNRGRSVDSKQGNADKLQEILNKLEKLDKLDDLEDRIETSTKQLAEKLESNNTKTESLNDECTKVKVEAAILKTQVSVHGLRLTDLEAQIEKLERERRRSTLVIDGVKETEHEDTADVVAQVFKDVGVDYGTRVCVNIFRRGRPQPNDRERILTGQQQKPEYVRPRPIVVVFLRQTEKGQFFRHLKNLQGKDEWKHVFFNDDLTELQESEQRDLRALVAYARSLKKEAKIKAGALWLEGRKYKYEELHKLPPEISLSKAKTLHILEDRAIVFQSPHSPLSNLFPCNLLFRGERFLSAEGAFHYHRALISGYEHEAQLIKATRNPFRVKKIALTLRATDEWERTSEDIMKEIISAKFTQVTHCKQFLIDTGDRKLFEGTGDKRWACGIPISKAQYISFKNPGRNLLGLMLEQIRDELKLK